MDPQDSIGFQEFLLDMDFDEFIPVDNFFSGYVRALDADSQSGMGVFLSVLSPCPCFIRSSLGLAAEKPARRAAGCMTVGWACCVSVAKLMHSSQY